MTKSSIATEYNEINENGRNGWMDKFQVKAASTNVPSVFPRNFFIKKNDD